MTMSPAPSSADQRAQEARDALQLDLDAQRREEAGADRATHRYQVLFHNAAFGVMVGNEAGRILQVNGRMCEMMGYTEDELLALPLKDVTHPDDIAMSAGVRAELVNGPQTWTQFEKRYLRQDGSVLTVVATVSRVDDLDGGGPVMLAIMEDVTARRAAEQALLDLNRTLERQVADRTAALARANREMEAFSYAVSHDLRAPLRAIHGFSLALLDEHDDQLDAEGRHCLSRIRANTLRMSDLVDALLSLSRLTGGDLISVPVDLADIARSVVEDVRQAHPDSVATISVLDRLPAMGDPRLLRIVLVNLIDNAVKFCLTEEHPRIVIGGNAAADSVHLSVEDNGAGFDMAYAEKLFAPFQRLHENTQFPGVGVGLATVFRILAHHGGRVWAEGSPDRGATFHIELPAFPQEPVL
jgi:PAS domain S-box-containing protein